MTEQSRSRWKLFDDKTRYLDRFGLLLTITVIAVVTLSLVDLSDTGSDLDSAVSQFTVSLFVGATLLLAVHASGVKRRFQLLADVFVGTGVAATALLVLLNLFGDPEAASSGFTTVIWIVLSLFAPVLVVRRLIHHQKATVRTLLGAVSAYLLIAVAFNFAYLTLNSFGDNFFGTVQPTTSFMYFSLVTITTLGYGDLAPAYSLGRLLSTMEAVIGQVYLVTFVAMIVGLLIQNRQRRPEGSSD